MVLNQVVKAFKKGSQTLAIYVDQNADSREWDNIGTIYSNHRDYSPDGKSLSLLEQLFMDGNGVIDFSRLDTNFVWCKVRAYIHSGIVVHAEKNCSGQMYDQWDSGLFAIIAVTKEKLKQDFGWKIITKKRREQIEGILENEIECLNMDYNGEVYGFIMYDGCGSTDSCWGYYGEDGIKQILEENDFTDAEELTPDPYGNIIIPDEDIDEEED